MNDSSKQRNGLSHSDAGKLGQEKSKAIHQLHKQQRIDAYNAKPKRCEYCGKVFEYKDRFKRFCNSSCAAKFNNAKRIASGWKRTEESKQRIKLSLQQTISHEAVCEICGKVFISTAKTRFICNECKQIHKHSLNNYGVIKKCKWCGAFKGECKRPNICKHHGVFKSLIKYFGFDESAIGSERVYEEFDKCYALLYKDYYENKLSLSGLVEKYNHYDAGNMSKILKSLNIPLRNHHDASQNAILNRKWNYINKSDSKCSFKHGWHTDWQGNKWFFRSSYEEKQMIEYDEKKINYKVEFLKILYYDTQQNVTRIAIPDFYLPDTNEIIEIKGYKWETEEVKQNMRDKFKTYKEYGYKPTLICENDILGDNF